MKPAPHLFGCLLALAAGAALWALIAGAALWAKAALSGAATPFPTSQTGDHRG